MAKYQNIIIERARKLAALEHGNSQSLGGAIVDTFASLAPFVYEAGDNATKRHEMAKTIAKTFVRTWDDAKRSAAGEKKRSDKDIKFDVSYATSALRVAEHDWYQSAFAAMSKVNNATPFSFAVACKTLRVLRDRKAKGAVSVDEMAKTRATVINRKRVGSTGTGRKPKALAKINAMVDACVGYAQWKGWSSDAREHFNRVVLELRKAHSLLKAAAAKAE